MILVSWISSLILDVTWKGYTPDPTIHLSMMGLVGVIFTAGVLKKE